jgi:hypothetical protein
MHGESEEGREWDNDFDDFQRTRETAAEMFSQHIDNGK